MCRHLCEAKDHNLTEAVLSLARRSSHVGERAYHLRSLSTATEGKIRALSKVSHTITYVFGIFGYQNSTNIVCVSYKLACTKYKPDYAKTLAGSDLFVSRCEGPIVG